MLSILDKPARFIMSHRQDLLRLETRPGATAHQPLCINQHPANPLHLRMGKRNGVQGLASLTRPSLLQGGNELASPDGKELPVRNEAVWSWWVLCGRKKLDCAQKEICYLTRGEAMRKCVPKCFSALESEEQLSAKCVIVRETRPDVFPARARGVGDQHPCYHRGSLVVASRIGLLEQRFGYRACYRWIMGDYDRQHVPQTDWI